MMSSIPSMPTARRTSPGVTPAGSCSSGVSCEWVVDAGWITSERTSPMFATWLCRVERVDELLARIDPAGQLERHDRARTPRGE